MTVCAICCSTAADGVTLHGPVMAVVGPVMEDGGSAVFPLLVELGLGLEFAAFEAGRVFAPNWVVASVGVEGTVSRVSVLYWFPMDFISVVRCY